MESYWKSEELKFYGSGGVIKGWQSTLERYKKSYPTKAHFGTLRFVYNDISKINDGAYSVMGEYHLTREVGDTNGIFMLILKNHFNTRLKLKDMYNKLTRCNEEKLSKKQIKEMTIRMEEISREKKYNIITNGDNTNPKVLSNNNEKNTVNFDRPLAFKTNPKNCKKVIFIKKKS